MPQCDLIHFLSSRLRWPKFSTRVKQVRTRAVAILITSMIHCTNIDQLYDNDDNNNSMWECCKRWGQTEWMHEWLNDVWTLNTVHVVWCWRLVADARMLATRINSLAKLSWHSPNQPANRPFIDVINCIVIIVSECGICLPSFTARKLIDTQRRHNTLMLVCVCVLIIYLLMQIDVPTWFTCSPLLPNTVSFHVHFKSTRMPHHHPCPTKFMWMHLQH